MKRLKKFLILSLAVVMATGVMGGQTEYRAYADSGVKSGIEEMEELLFSLDSIGEDNYKKYAEAYKSYEYTGEDIVFDLLRFSEDERTCNTKNSANFTVTVPKTGLYVVGFDYLIKDSNILRTSLSLTINGNEPFKELRRLSFDDIWESGETLYDRYGNESIAMPEKKYEQQFTYLKDTAFLQNEPFMLYLAEGENEFSFIANEGSVEFIKMYLLAAKEVKEQSNVAVSGDEVITIEAEDFVLRNSPNIRTLASFDPSVTPYSSYLKKQNVVDEDSFRIGGTYVEYDFTVVEEGYYYLALDYIQSKKSNFTVYRNIYIDGELPSYYYENVGFPYSTKYKRELLESPVYLTEGEHTLKIEVSLEPYGDAVNILNDIVENINDLALSINKITGGNTDKYRDFDLEAYGMNIEKNLNEWADIIEKVYELLCSEDEFGTKNGEIKLLQASSKTLRKLAENPNDLPENIDQFSYGNSSVRQYLTDVSENLSYGNLGIDKIYFYQNEKNLPKKVNAFDKTFMKIEHFIASFVQGDYTPSYDSEEKTLEVWVNRPRQYLEIMQRMADSDFTEKTGIKVNLSIVPDQQKLILANASGKAPDAAVGISTAYVYDMALRGALVDFRKNDNFSEVASRFAPGMLIPGVCDEGVYAIPETFNFYVLYYRTDIFEKLNLKVPDNMDEVREMLPELERMGLGFNTHVANTQNKNFECTAPFLFQAGADIFGDDFRSVDLETKESVNGLKCLTENFTVYDMDYEILNFYQSFRDGRTPIGVSNYGTYNLLTNAAPELNGCWDIALYPGMVKEDGTVDRSTSGTAECSVSFASSDMQDEAWAFICWWMSDEVQTEFSFTLQSTLGNEYMWNSANLNAIAKAPWNESDKAVILEQISYTNEMPRVPGSYMIERELGNILVNTVTNNENLRTAIDNAQKRINAELLRKLEEFNYIDSEGNVLKELVIPDIELIEEWINEEK